MRFQAASVAVLSAAVFTAVQAAPLTSSEIEQKTSEGLRLLAFNEIDPPEWKSEDEKLDLMRQKVQFMDVTESWEKKQTIKEKKAKSAKKATFPALSHQDIVNPLIEAVSISNMQDDLDVLTEFNNRYYKSDTGGEAADWIRSTVSDLTSGRDDIEVSEFTHSWTQSSTILKFAGSDTSAPTTILGAHMDSINLNSPTSGRAPGADDDGTGTVNLIEVVRVLVDADYEPATPLEFHWYSGEEAGLLGSQAIASSYADDDVEVQAFMELDMTGYFAPGSKEVMALQADYIDEGLNTWLGALIDEYSRFGWDMDIACGYACSDHASWNEYGYPTSFPYEAITGDDDPEIHSADDTVDVEGFSWDHSVEFAKVGVAFAVEMTSA